MKNKNRIVLVMSGLILGASLFSFADRPPTQIYTINFTNPSTSCSLFVEEIDNSCTYPNTPNFLGVTEQLLSPKGVDGEEGNSANIGFQPFLDTDTSNGDCTVSYASFKFTYGDNQNWSPMVCTVQHGFGDDGSTVRTIQCEGDRMNVDGGADQFSPISFSPDIQELRPCSNTPPDGPPSAG